jgi:hypothetical protein
MLGSVAVRTCRQGHPARARLSRGPLLRVIGRSEAMVPMNACNMRRYVRAWRVGGKGGGAGIWQLVGAECPGHQTTAGCTAHTSVWARTKAGKLRKNLTSESPQALESHGALAWQSMLSWVAGGSWLPATSKCMAQAPTWLVQNLPQHGHPVECKRSCHHGHSLSKGFPSALLGWAASRHYVVLGCSRMGACLLTRTNCHPNWQGILA